MTEKSNRFGIIIPVLLALMFIAGYFLGTKNSLTLDGSGVFSENSNNKLNALLDYINAEYVDPVNVDSLVELAIPKLLEELDPHTVYIPPQDLQETNEQLIGAFDGIGVQFNIQSDTVVVIHPIPGGPSEKVGVLAGDRIVKVDDSLIAGVGIENDQVMSLLKGQKGTKVTISVHRSGDRDLIPFEITRDKIPMYSVDAAYMIDSEIGYIKVNRFARNTYQEFMDGGMKLLQQGCKKMILDLRGNSGGFMEVAIKMADEFLEAGQLIVYTEGKARPKDEAVSSSRGHFKDVELIVLIDEWSASASEIVAGAIQDNDRGKIIGRRSFGKGLVQEQSEFKDGSGLRLTIARYYTPSGRCIQKPYDREKEDLFASVHGGMQNSDPAFNSDTLNTDTTRYFTRSGRVVYGGGGILPDILTAVDTSSYTSYFMKVRNRGHIYQYAFDYADEHRKEFSEMTGWQELNRHLDRKKLLTDFISFAEKKGISPNPEELKKSENLISTLLVAQISRNIFDDEGFYPIIQEVDETILKAIENFN